MLTESAQLPHYPSPEIPSPESRAPSPDYASFLKMKHFK